jgi:putative RNA 2'-phosphotransferase
LDRVASRRISKRLSYVLRHAPDSVGVQLDAAGWVPVDDLLAALARHGLRLTRRQLEHVVATNDKRRFALDASGRRIRASQGHSVPVELGYAPTEPPTVLFHGTAVRNVRAILEAGLRPGGRHAVHLSPDVAAARLVGARRGKHVVLEVDSGAMAEEGHRFSCSANGVWLVAAVPPEFLRPLSRRTAGIL